MSPPLLLQITVFLFLFYSATAHRIIPTIHTFSVAPSPEPIHKEIEMELSANNDAFHGRVKVTLSTVDCAALEQENTAAAPSTPEPEGATRAQLVEQYKSLISNSWNSKCLELKKGWWTYRVCFGEETRQFHGQDVYVMGRQYVVESHDQVVFTNGDACEAAQKQPHAPGEEGYIVANRITRVQLMCGTNFALVDIQEREVCQYYMLVTSPDLCPHAERSNSDTATTPVLYESYKKDTASPITLTQSNRDSWVLAWEDGKMFTSEGSALIKGAALVLKRVNQEMKSKRDVCLSAVRIELGLEPDRVLSVDAFEDSFGRIQDALKVSSSGAFLTTISTGNGFSGRMDMIRVRVSVEK